MQEEIKEIKKRLNKLEKEVTSANDDYELFLWVDSDNYLSIGYKDNDDFFTCIGYISDSGELNILNVDGYRENYKIWVENGMKIKENNEVEWRGKRYKIKRESCLTFSKSYFGIYDFKFAIPMTGCEDDNIIRYEHNNTPILF
jgi:hypothetical protein